MVYMFNIKIDNIQVPSFMVKLKEYILAVHLCFEYQTCPTNEDKNLSFSWS